MMSDPLADRVRKAVVESFPVPVLPEGVIAARIAAARSAPARARRKPWFALAGGAVLLAGGLAVAAPVADKWFTPAYYATLKRLTGHDFSHAKSFPLEPMTLKKARSHSTFPVVVPRGKRVLNAIPLRNNQGFDLVIAVDVHAQAVLEERWADANVSKLAAKLQGIGIHNDGSIRRFNVRRWRIGRIAFSMTMFTLEYHRYAEEVERATREAAAGAP